MDVCEPWRPSLAVAAEGAATTAPTTTGPTIATSTTAAPIAAEWAEEVASAATPTAAAAAAAPRALGQAAGGGGGDSGGAPPSVPSSIVTCTATPARLAQLMALEGGVHMHLLMLVCGDDDDGGSSGSVEAPCQQVEAGFAAGGSLGPAVHSAVRRLLLEAPVGADGGGSDAHSAFAWPPVVPLLSGTAEEGPGAVGRAHGAQLAQPGEVLLLLPTALLEGQTAVRCVVAGPSGQTQQQQQVHLDATLAIAIASGGSGGCAGSGADGGYSAFRLMLPPAALQRAGALAVFVLQQSLAPSASGFAPLAAFPLLVLPEPAATEVWQLYGGVLDPEVYGSLQQLLCEERTAAAVPGGWHLAASTSAAAASASTAIQQSGLTSLSHDIGALLQLPDSAAEEALEGGAAGSDALVQQLPFHALPFADVLCFLASQRMGACLWGGLRALQRAGMQLAYAGLNVLGGSGGDGASEAEVLQLIRAERSYQAFKAAQCWRANLMAFGLVAAMRLSTCLRTLRVVRAADTALMPAAVDGIGAGRLTELQQQLLTQALYVGVAFLFAVLASCTPLLRRRRTALLLLYKAVVDPVTFLLILWPPAWGGPLLRPPEAWSDAGRRYGVHWLYQSVLEPSLLQLAPRHQLWSVLANLLPMTLLGYHVYQGRWGPALRFGAGDAVLGLAMSCAIDLATRRQFVRQRRGYSGKTE